MSPQSPESIHETPADRLRDLVAGFIENVASQGEKAIDVLGRRVAGTHWTPQVDIIETESDVQVLVDVPGIDPERVEILLAGNMLTVRGELPKGDRPSGATTHRCERPTGSFTRTVPLPVAVDPERVAASSQHGVLTVTLAKEERIRPRHIRVNPAG